jgi:hypothetical protein
MDAKHQTQSHAGKGEGHDRFPEDGSGMVSPTSGDSPILVSGQEDEHEVGVGWPG